MGVLLNNTKLLINISSISFVLLNAYIIYSKVRFDLSIIPFASYFSISIAFCKLFFYINSIFVYNFNIDFNL